MSLQNNLSAYLKNFLTLLFGFVIYWQFGWIWLLTYLLFLVSFYIAWHYFINGYTAPILPAPDGVYRIACVGDSITYGAMVKERAKNCYPNQLEQMLGPGFAVRNFGVNGHTLLKSTEFPYWKHKNNKISQDFAPNLVLIMLGTNDSKAGNWTSMERFIRDYREMIHVYKSLPTKPLVFVLTPATAHLPHGFKRLNYGMDNTVMDQMGQAMKQMAAEDELPLIDIRAITANRPDCFPFDGIHTNVAGASLIAETVFGAISSQIGLSSAQRKDLS